jgi:hypothetical protein
MKLIPKGAKFCPGCLSKLSLKPAPQVVIKAEEKQDSKAITIIGTSKKKTNNNSLF